MTGTDLLLLLAPPLALIDKLDATPNLPQAVTDWAEVWKTIRSSGPSVIDTAMPETYQQALIIVEEKRKVY